MNNFELTGNENALNFATHSTGACISTCLRAVNLYRSCEHFVGVAQTIISPQQC